MTFAVDTSVAVAAFAPWHEAHKTALAAARGAYLPAHCAMETYSTLTRLPEPFRSPAEVVAQYLVRRFADRWLFLPGEALMALPSQLAELGILGGAVYDALVAATARHNDATLRTLDERAQRTYHALGADYEVVGVGSY